MSAMQSGFEIVDPEEQHQAMAGFSATGIAQRRVAVIAPRVQAEQHGAAGIDQLPEMAVGWFGWGETEQ